MKATDIKTASNLKLFLVQEGGDLLEVNDFLQKLDNKLQKGKLSHQELQWLIIRSPFRLEFHLDIAKLAYLMMQRDFWV